MTGSTIAWSITRNFSVVSRRRVLHFAKVGEHPFENSDSGGLTKWSRRALTVCAIMRLRRAAHLER